ncbi:unnamed protein product [Laminaria digitata]
MYRSVGSDPALLEGVLNGNMRGAKAALADGANVNGSPRLLIPPISAAAAMNEVGMVKLMIKHGADPDRQANRDVASPSTDIGVKICEGDRPLHVAAKLGRLEIVRLLLQWAGADPNATNKPGRTPLMAACACLDNRAEVVRSLLEAGADATMADENGYTALHVVGFYGRIDLVDVLHAEAPDTLSRVASTGETPLCIACAQGRENVVTRLLSLGATHPVSGDDHSACALSMAAMKGREGIVRILVEEGLGAVGGRTVVMPDAMYTAIRSRHAGVLRMLLAADWEEPRSVCANTAILGRRLLHYGAGYCYPAAVSVLLAAGADENTRDFAQLTPLDCIGLEPGPEANKVVSIGPGQEVAIRRMLQRGPAYRARSWAWPAAAEDADTGGDDGGGGGRDTRRLGVASVWYSTAAKTPSVPRGMRIFQSKAKSCSSSSRRRLFVNVVGRYCQKAC